MKIITRAERRNEEDIELKQGMILEEDLFSCQYIITNNGLYYGEVFNSPLIGSHAKEIQSCKTLQELNNKSSYKWKVLY